MKHSLSYHSVSPSVFKKTELLRKEKRKQLSSYIDQLMWWNKRLNLVSRNVSRETMDNHVFHSLLLSQFATFQRASSIVDTGTGGGLPGMPLAITCPNKHYILNDIVTKKVLALKQMVKKGKLNDTIPVDQSIENLLLENPCLIISKHAFKINELFKMVSGKPWTQLIFFKGLSFKEELIGIEQPLNIQVHKLETGTDNPFYTDKALIVISK